MKIVLNIKGQPEKNDLILYNGKEYVFKNCESFFTTQTQKVKDLEAEITELKEQISEYKQSIVDLAKIIKENSEQ